MQHLHENKHSLNAFTLTLFVSNQCRQRSRIQRLFAEVVAESVEIGHCTESTHTSTQAHFLSFRHINTHAWTQNMHINVHAWMLCTYFFHFCPTAFHVPHCCPFTLKISLFCPLMPLFSSLSSPTVVRPLLSLLNFAQRVCVCVCVRKHVVSMCVRFQVSSSVMEV